MSTANYICTTPSTLTYMANRTRRQMLRTSSVKKIFPHFETLVGLFVGHLAISGSREPFKKAWLAKKEKEPGVLLCIV